MAFVCHHMMAANPLAAAELTTNQGLVLVLVSAANKDWPGNTIVAASSALRQLIVLPPCRRNLPAKAGRSPAPQPAPPATAGRN